MTSRPTPSLDLAALLAAKVFNEDDLAHNRRGVLSPRQDAWRAAHPRFMDGDDGSDGAVEVLVGRVTIEGQYIAGSMGDTTFAELALPGRRLSLHPALERNLVRGAPYRAHAAYGWIWSIEPITEAELNAGASGIATYRSSGEPLLGTFAVAQALEEALSLELSFTADDVEANRNGRFSPAQRSVGRKKLVSATLGLVIATVALGGLGALVAAGAPFPVFATLSGAAALCGFWATSAWSLVDALGRLVKPRPLSAIARLDTDPTNRDNLVLESEGRPLKIKRAAIAIAEAPFSALRAWRFEVHFVPWTRSVLAVRPLAPPEGKD